jgi:hypothetical protein
LEVITVSVFPVQPGSPDYSTGSSSQYIPAIYSALLVKKFYPQTIFGMISNSDYEGDIKSQGDTVYIRTRPTIETFKYKKGMVLPVQNPESPYVTLKIDQGEGFSFAIDKVDEFQSDIKLMNVWAEDASAQMKQVIDRNVLISMAMAGAVAGGQASTTIVGYAGSTVSLNYAVPTAAAPTGLVAGGYTAKGTAISTNLAASNAAASCNTGDELTARILRYARYLDENNAPSEGRFCVLPTWAGEVLKSFASNSFGLAYATGQNQANALSGSLPKLDRFDLIFSNNMPLTTEGSEASPVFFGVKYATTFATQITESRIIDNPFAFGKMMQGLQVYGFNVIKPQMFGVDFIKNA